MNYSDVINAIKAIKKPRKIIAIAGAPASGKSTLAATLAEQIPNSALFAMDGFHLDDAILIERGHLMRKGSPQTFDALGFSYLLERLAMGQDDIYAPSFDRDLEVSRNASVFIPKSVETIIVEGNYVLLDDPSWTRNAKFYDLTIMLHVPIEEIKRRLVKRWQHYQLDEQAAAAKIQENDLPNAELVTQNSVKADLVFSGDIALK